MMMKKWLSAILMAVSLLTVTVFAMPIGMDILGGGLSVLDSLLLIGVGLALLGVLFLCIALLKPQRIEEEPEEGDTFLKQLIEETALKNGDADESETEIDDPSEEEPEEALEDLEEEPVAENFEEPETEEIEEAEEKIPEESVPEVLEEEPEPVSKGSYPTLTLTGINNGEFKILPLKEAITLGRRPENDLIFSDTTISGIHCEIMVEEDKVYVVDKDSTNGTYINGQKITEKTEIHKGDVMVLGQMELKISI